MKNIITRVAVSLALTFGATLVATAPAEAAVQPSSTTVTAMATRHFKNSEDSDKYALVYEGNDCTGRKRYVAEGATSSLPIVRSFWLPRKTRAVMNRVIVYRTRNTSRCIGSFPPATSVTLLLRNV